MTAATAGGIKRPPLTHTVKLDDGKEKEIKLTYGLQQDIQRLVPNPEEIVDVLTANPWTRDYIIRRCMLDKKGMVKDLEAELPEEIDLSDPDEISMLLQWVTEHLLYFFAMSAGGMKRLHELFREMFKVEAQPAPSTTGSDS